MITNTRTQPAVAALRLVALHGATNGRALAHAHASEWCAVRARAKDDAERAKALREWTYWETVADAIGGATVKRTAA